MKKSLLFLSLIASFTTLNAQWTAQATGFNEDSRGLSEVHIVDANTVWALAYDGSGGGANVQQCTMTTDGGTTWFARDIDFGDPSLEINNICPVNGTTAFVSAIVNIGNNNPTDGTGFINRTTDGGVNWELLDTGGFQTNGSSFLNGVYFWNAQVGVAYGDPEGGEFEIYRTTDGGDTWSRVAGASIANPLSNEYGYNSVPVAAGGTLWFPTNRGRLFRTTDMGLTWTAHQVTNLTDFGGTAQSATVTFSNATNGYLLKTAGTTYTYMTSVDGGANWSAPLSFSGTRRILKYIPGTNIIVATSQAAPVGTSVSINNGATWQSVETAEQRGASDFLDLTTGWCAGFSQGPFDGGIFKLTGTLANSVVNAAKFTVYPNPANSIVTISTPEVDSANLSVTDLSGKIVMTKSLSGIENTVDVSNLSTGAYFFEVSSDSKKEVIKILKN